MFILISYVCCAEQVLRWSKRFWNLWSIDVHVVYTASWCNKIRKSRLDFHFQIHTCHCLKNTGIRQIISRVNGHRLYTSTVPVRNWNSALQFSYCSSFFVLLLFWAASNRFFFLSFLFFIVRSCTEYIT